MQPMFIAELEHLDDAQALALARQMLNAAIGERDAAVHARDAALATIAQQEKVLHTRERTIVHRDAQIAALTAEIARLRRLQYAAKSERMSSSQRELFEETMAGDIAAVEAQLQALQQQRQPEPQPRLPKRQPTRQPLPEHLPRLEQRHELQSCTCPQCQGQLVAIGEHVSERLALKPLQFYVLRDIYPQYACRACEQVVAKAVAPALIERGQADASLLAQVAVAKYVDHLPLYRQEAIYARSGISLARSTLAEWIGAIGVALQPLAQRLAQKLRAQPTLHADETPVAMLDAKAGKTKRAYLFAYTNARCQGADPRVAGPPMVLFEFQPSRSGQHARDFLSDWRGSLMVDEYSGYKGLWPQGITELGCWAHVRRKWFEQHAASSSAIAAEALVRIGVLYRIEREAAHMTVEQRQAHRLQHAVPALQALKAWLDALQPTLMGNSGTARALLYTLRRWDALVRYAQDGSLPIDNHVIENAIRPIALGRKNWLFAGSQQAGQRAAAIMSLLATAKANGIEPHAWLADTLTRLPTTLYRDIDSLLPLRTA